MEDALRCCLTVQDVLFLARPGKKVKAKANALRTALRKKRMIDKETNAEQWPPSQTQRKMNAWQDYICHKIDVSKEFDAEFKFPKILLLGHWVQQIPWYGTLPQYSAERHEQALETNLKVGWNTSNHNLNYLPQVINCQHRILCFEIRQLNL